MRLSSSLRLERGDTIIEVIFAIAIFAFVAVSSLAIMNQGVTTAERALETTLVRQQMDAQAEALRYIHDVRLASPASGSTSAWAKLIAKYGRSSASPYGPSGNKCVLPESGSYFILNARTAQVWASPPTIEPAAGANFPPYPQVVYNSYDSSIAKAYGLWVEAVPSGFPIMPRFIDFHIRACWSGPGSSVPMTLGTIVRLYDPR